MLPNFSMTHRTIFMNNLTNSFYVTLSDGNFVEFDSGHCENIMVTWNSIQNKLIIRPNVIHIKFRELIHNQSINKISFVISPFDIVNNSSVIKDSPFAKVLPYVKSSKYTQNQKLI